MQSTSCCMCGHRSLSAWNCMPCWPGREFHRPPPVWPQGQPRPCQCRQLKREISRLRIKEFSSCRSHIRGHRLVSWSFISRWCSLRTAWYVLYVLNIPGKVIGVSPYKTTRSMRAWYLNRVIRPVGTRFTLKVTKYWSAWSINPVIQWAHELRAHEVGIGRIFVAHDNTTETQCQMHNDPWVIDTWSLMIWVKLRVIWPRSMTVTMGCLYWKKRSHRYRKSQNRESHPVWSTSNGQKAPTFTLGCVIEIEAMGHIWIYPRFWCIWVLLHDQVFRCTGSYHSGYFIHIFIVVNEWMIRAKTNWGLAPVSPEMRLCRPITR